MKSIRWKVAAGWIVVAVVAWRFLVRPVTDYVLQMQGLPVPASPPDLSLTEVMALLGIPIGGAFADRVADGPSGQ